MKFLVYGIANGDDKFTKWTSDPLHTLAQAEAIVRLAEPWQRAFVRGYWDFHYDERDNNDPT